MIRLNSARRAWHDAFYTPWDSPGAQFEQISRLGCGIQETDRQRGSRRAMHQAMAGRIQQAITTLPEHVQAFGNHLYSPLATIDEQETAEETVWRLACQDSPRMTARKFEKSRYVAQAVLFRYRRIHQGGQGAGADPLPGVERMRNWIFDSFGIALVGDQWARDWGAFVEQCFAACDRLDRQALSPLGKALQSMQKVA